MHRLILSMLFGVLLLSDQTQAQTVIKRCANGSTVGGNSSCGGGGSSRYKPLDAYGVYAIDPINGEGSGVGISTEGRSEAKAAALKYCANTTKQEENCKVVLTFKNTCGAVAVVMGPQGKPIWATGLGKTSQNALDKALAICDEKAAKAGITKKEPCHMWVQARCALEAEM